LTVDPEPPRELRLRLTAAARPLNNDLVMLHNRRIVAVVGAPGCAGSPRDAAGPRTARLRYPSDMLQRIKTAIRFALMAFVAYGIIYEFPC
jgi:hypothetical protein